MVEVVHFMRHRNRLAQSIEQLFEDVRGEFSEEVSASVTECEHPSKGLIRRVVSMIRAGSQQKDINHVTGDVHFLTILMDPGKTILTIHDAISLSRMKGLAFVVIWLFWYWLPVKRGVQVTTVSEFSRDELKQYLGEDLARGIRVIPNCVSRDFRFSSREFNAQRPKILQVGTSPNKNLERVVKALRGLECELIVLGPVSESQQSLLSLSGIEYRQYAGLLRQEVVSHYEKADIVMFASLYEGFGLPILEANAVGRPVITSNRGPMPEVAGEAAILVDPESVLEIRQAVVSLIKEPEQVKLLIEKGVANVEKYSPKGVAAQYEALYHEVHRKNHAN